MTTISDTERASVTAKVAEYMQIGAHRMASEILGCVAEDYGYAMSLLIGCDAQKQAAAQTKPASPTVQRHRFGEVLDAPRYRPNGLSPAGWPTDEDGYER